MSNDDGNLPDLEASSRVIASASMNSQDVNATSESKSSVPALREDDESNIPCKFDKYCEPEVIIGRMLTNFNMVNAFTGESCPIVHLGDLAKIRGKKKDLCVARVQLAAVPLKSAIPPLLTKKMGSFY